MDRMIKHNNSEPWLTFLVILNHIVVRSACKDLLAH